jgi:DNA-binding GntR family transcriptional regulator
VREALRQLDAEGLVTIMPNRRAVVTRLTAAEVEEIFEIRAVLEGLAIRFAVPNFDKVRLAELTVLNEFLEKAKLDPRSWVQRHAEFHDFIVEVSGRQHLRKQIKRMHSAVQPYLLMYISVYQHTEMVGYEHDNVISLIRSGDPAAAETLHDQSCQECQQGVIEYVTRRDEGEKLTGAGARR